MKKKTISLFLVLLLLCYTTIPVYAGSYSQSGQYASSYYEVSDTCSSGSYRSITTCDSPDYLLKSNVQLWGPGYDASGNYVPNTQLFVDYGEPTTLFNANSGDYSCVVNQMICTHYVNGDPVCTTYVNP